MEWCCVVDEFWAFVVSPREGWCKALCSFWRREFSLGRRWCAVAHALGGGKICEGGWNTSRGEMESWVEYVVGVVLVLVDVSCFSVYRFY